LCEAWIGDLAGVQNEPGLAVRLELHARLLRLADALPASDPKTEGRQPRALLGEGGLTKVEQLAAYIAQHYQSSIRIEEIAKEVGLHPNYAMGLFRKTFDLTINEYLTQHRLSHAQRLLASTDLNVIDVALDSGFATLSRFYDTFKKSCGCSPSTYRRKHRI
jgi:AraC-like DNA-binding protein